MPSAFPSSSLSAMGTGIIYDNGPGIGLMLELELSRKRNERPFSPFMMRWNGSRQSWRAARLIRTMIK